MKSKSIIWLSCKLLRLSQRNLHLFWFACPRLLSFIPLFLYLLVFLKATMEIVEGAILSSFFDVLFDYTSSDCTQVCTKTPFPNWAREPEEVASVHLWSAEWRGGEAAERIFSQTLAGWGQAPDLWCGKHIGGVGYPIFGTQVEGGISIHHK